MRIYEDAGVSGAKGRDQRPAFDQMLKAVAQRRLYQGRKIVTLGVERVVIGMRL